MMREALTKVAIAAAMFGATAFVATGASAQLAANQTAGFAKEELHLHLHRTV
jgi:hypothetical protein